MIATLFWLGLNVSSTRLILLTGQAGNVINSFGQFVVGGNYVGDAAASYVVNAECVLIGDTNLHFESINLLMCLTK